MTDPAGDLPPATESRALRAEVAIMLAVTFGLSAITATLQLIDFALRGLADQKVALNPRRSYFDLIDLGLTYSPVKDVDIYASVQNLTNVQYLASGYTLTSFEGSTVNASAIPALGMPLTATAGLRVRF